MSWIPLCTSPRIVVVLWQTRGQDERVLHFAVVTGTRTSSLIVGQIIWMIFFIIDHCWTHRKKISPVCLKKDEGTHNRILGRLRSSAGSGTLLWMASHPRHIQPNHGCRNPTWRVNHCSSGTGGTSFLLWRRKSAPLTAPCCEMSSAHAALSSIATAGGGRARSHSRTHSSSRYHPLVPAHSSTLVRLLLCAIRQ